MVEIGIAGEMPRVLRVVVLDQARGVWGAQRYVLRLAPLLRKQGIELILAGPSELELHRAWQDAGFEGVQLDLPIERSIRSAGRPALAEFSREVGNGVGAVRAISRLVRRGGYDAIWANAHWTHAEATVAGRVCRTPVVLHLHEEAVPGLGQWIRNGAVQLASRTVAVSQAVSAGIPGYLRRRVDVIANGVDTEAMSPPSEGEYDELLPVRKEFGIGHGDIMVLAATRLDPVKRIEDLIDAVSATAEPRIHLVIAGETSSYPSYARDVKARAAGLVGQVSFCGPREDIDVLFRASDVVLHAGVVEGMPLGLLEAQSCGRPVAAYAVAGVPEAVVDGTTGLLAAAGDVAGLSEALAKLATDTRLRVVMGAAARAHVLAHHRIETQAARNATLIKEMCHMATQ